MLLLSNSEFPKTRVGYPALSFSNLEDIVMSEVKRFEDSKHILGNFVSVGDTINGLRIHEIWVTSLGNPRFAVGSEHYDWDELFSLAPAGEKVDV